jgi:hypothetical protein
MLPMNAGSVARPLASSRQQGFVLGLLLLFVGLSVQYSFKAFGSHTPTRSAFLRWRQQILDLSNGTDVYLRYNYPNAPIMPLLLTPLAQLPPLVGSLSWFYLKVAMALVSIYWVCRLVETRRQPFPGWAKALAILLSLRPIMGDLSHGNVNLFILFLVVAALYLFHHRRDLGAGLLLALSITCKVTPLLFVPYLVWKRAWTALAGCALGLVLFFWVVPGCFLGMDHNARLLASWYERMIEPFVVEGVVTTEHINQSVPGLVYRLATHSPSSLKYVNDQPVGAEYHNLWELDPDQARWLVKGCMALFAGLILWTCRTPATSRQGWRLAAEYSLVVLGMLLFSERTWKHHCVTLLLPFAVVAYYLGACRPGPRLRLYLIGTLAAVALLMASTSTSLVAGRARLPRLEGAKLAQVYGAYVWAYLLLVAALAVLLKQPAAPAQACTPQTPADGAPESPGPVPAVP